MIGLLLVLNRFTRALRASVKDPEFRALLVMFSTLVLIGTAFYRRVEGWPWIDCLYFSVVTLATVGYGDYAPTTTMGKIFTMFYIIIGIGVLVAFASKLVGGMLQTREGGMRQRVRQELHTLHEVESVEAENQGPASTT